MGIAPKTDFEKQVREYAKEFGGFFNAHVHGDRAFTYRDEYYFHKGKSVFDIEKSSLEEKQALVWALHSGRGFENDCIEQRMRRLFDASMEFGVRRIDTTADVTYNTQMRVWEIAEKLREEYKGRLEIRLGAYNVSGFEDDKPERFKFFEDAVRRADFLVALAEKDRKSRNEKNIGEKQHNVYMLRLGAELGKPVHFHVGQANSPDERNAELLFECADWVYNQFFRMEEYPRNMLIHDISSSCYSENDFDAHCQAIKGLNFGVICCPSAALSMRQDRKREVPTHNSLARIWDFALQDIPVFLGGDNINDVFVPPTSPDLFDEIAVLANALRFYNPRVLAKVACGTKLEPFDKSDISAVLK